MKKFKRLYLLHRHPWLPGGLTIAYVLFGLTVPIVFIYFPSIGDEAPRFLHFVSFVLISAPITLTILQILNFRRSVINIRYLALLYLEIIIMFGVIYFYEVSSRSDADLQCEINGDSRIPAIRGIDSDWVYLIKTQQIDDKQALIKEMLVCFQDSIHFSLITSTTVGYGDMVPVKPTAKLLVDIQVLVSFFLISFGVAAFSSAQRHRHDNREVEQLKERITLLESKSEE